MCHGDNAARMDSIIFAFHTAGDETLYVERWPEYFPKHGPAASVPAGPVPVARGPAASAYGGQSKTTRHGRAAAGLQPTPATTARMYLVVERPEDADGPSRGGEANFRGDAGERWPGGACIQRRRRPTAHLPELGMRPAVHRSEQETLSEVSLDELRCTASGDSVAERMLDARPAAIV